MESSKIVQHREMPVFARGFASFSREPPTLTAVRDTCAERRDGRCVPGTDHPGNDHPDTV
jgi:hypothetical protein